MTTTPSSLEALIEALRCLPGVGPKSAQRMAYHLMQRERPGARRLADALQRALDALCHCQRCNTLTEAEICERCLSPRRDPAQLCVVETPVDMNMMEQTQAYTGLYYVLMGRVSPLDGVGPRELQLEQLLLEGLWIIFYLLEEFMEQLPEVRLLKLKIINRMP